MSFEAFTKTKSEHDKFLLFNFCGRFKGTKFSTVTKTLKSGLKVCSKTTDNKTTFTRKKVEQKHLDWLEEKLTISTDSNSLDVGAC